MFKSKKIRNIFLATGSVAVVATTVAVPVSIKLSEKKLVSTSKEIDVIKKRAINQDSDWNGLLGISSKDFQELYNSIKNNKWVIEMINTNFNINLEDFFQNISSDEIYNLIQVLNNKGITQFNDNNFASIKNVIKQFTTPKKAKYYYTFIETIRTFTNSNLKDTLIKNKNVLEAFLPKSNINFQEIFSKILFDGFNDVDFNEKDPKKIIKTMADWLSNQINNAGLINSDSLPSEAKDIGMDVAKVNELINKILNNLLVKLFDPLSSKYSVNKLEIDLDNILKEIPNLKDSFDQSSELIKNNDVVADYKKYRKSYDALIDDKNTNGPYAKLLNELKINAQIIDKGKKIIGTALASWYEEKVKIDAILGVAAWYNYNDDIKNSPISKQDNVSSNKDDWNQKVKDLYLKDDVPALKFWLSDGNTLEQYLKSVLSQEHYDEYINTRTKILNISGGKVKSISSNIFKDKSPNYKKEQIQLAKIKLDPLKKIMKEHNNLKEKYEEALRKKDNLQGSIDKINLEKSFGFTKNAMLNNKFFKGEGLLLLNEKDLKNLIFALSELSSNLSSNLNQAIEEAVNDTEFNVASSFLGENLEFLDGFASSVASGTIVDTIKNLDIIKQLKNNAYLKAFNDIDIEDFSNLFYKIINKNIFTLNFEDIKFILQTIPKFISNWEFNFSDETIKFFWDILKKGINQAKKNNPNSVMLVSDLLKKFFNLDINDWILEYLIG